MDDYNDFIDCHVGYMDRVQQAFDAGMNDLCQHLADVAAQMVVDYVMNQIRVNEPYLIYTEQERL